jgi:hypothetical protein
MSNNKMNPLAHWRRRIRARRFVSLPERRLLRGFYLVRHGLLEKAGARRGTPPAFNPSAQGWRLRLPWVIEVTIFNYSEGVE